MGNDRDKKCTECIGYGHCKLHSLLLDMEGHIPKIIEDGAASICTSFAPKIDWEKTYKEFMGEQ